MRGVMVNGRMAVRRRQQVVAVIQARIGSYRLPGKVMMPIGDRPMLRHVIERVEAARGIDRIVVATSDQPEDLAIATYMRDVLPEHDVCAVPEPMNVLRRFAVVAHVTQATAVIRITSDCPLVDPALIEAVLAAYQRGADYASNVWPRTFPDGLDVEAFSAKLLYRMHERATDPAHREHVTAWLHSRRQMAIIRSVQHDTDLSALRWTVDTQDDLDFVREVYQRMAPRTLFGWRDVLALGAFAQRKAVAA